ncbi:unnamed protein product [Cuscuta epithymum]|uniref:Uncharacterized protein n=1 Tax=Cuscuta epithymum TaxID=186058 RepID=A0AAV0BWK3_9ASTE|nr:unnamed protein product [Cuscuta epithymum]CAH9143447.1 unnamed protein product [Cuscuta epithymum]
MEDIVNQYKSMAIEAGEWQARPPPEPPPWSARGSRVWKKMSEFCFNSILFYLCFSFELHVVLGVFLFPSRKILEFRSSDEKYGLPIRLSLAQYRGGSGPGRAWMRFWFGKSGP